MLMLKIKVNPHEVINIKPDVTIKTFNHQLWDQLVGFTVKQKKTQFNFKNSKHTLTLINRKTGACPQTQTWISTRLTCRHLSLSRLCAGLLRTYRCSGGKSTTAWRTQPTASTATTWWADIPHSRVLPSRRQSSPLPSPLPRSSTASLPSLHQPPPPPSPLGPGCLGITSSARYVTYGIAD